jgi:hypothetical protein
MRRRPKTNGKRTSGLHRRVKQLAAAGLVEDQIVLRVGGGIDKNQLRRRYIDSIKEGRAAAQEAQAAAEAAEMSKRERALRELIERTFKSRWYTKEHGNLLFDGAHTVDEAVALVRSYEGNTWGV